MKTLLQTIGLTLALLCLVCVVQAQEAKKPSMMVSQENWDFGEVWHPEKPAMTLVIRNEGQADLKLDKVRSTCGCTVAQPSRMLIPPGESTDVKIVFDTTGKQDEVTSKVIITSNDPIWGEYTFKIRGFVKRAIRRTPLGGLVIRTLETKAGQTGKVTLENQMSEPMHLKIVSNNVAEVDLKIEEITPGLLYEVVGRTNRDVQHGTIRGEIVLSTGLAQEETITVSVQVNVLPRVRPVPAAMFFRTDDSKAYERTINIHYYGTDDDFKVTSATCKHKDVKVTLGAMQPPSAGYKKLKPSPTAFVRAMVSLPPANQIPDEGILIEFTTTDPDWPKFDVLATTNKRDFQERMYGRVMPSAPTPKVITPKP